MSRIDVYTDGGARPNPGPGGWGVVILQDGEPRELSGGADETTNNRMELTAAIRALEELRGAGPVRLHTDSVYVRSGITRWLPDWVRRGWKRKSGELVNEDLWRRLAELDRAADVEWKWVKGHAGDRWNERADELASAEVARHGGAAVEAAVAAVPDGDREVFLRISCAKGRGGWAAAVRHAPSGAPGEEALEETVTGQERNTTPNRLDLLAAAELLEGLEAGSEVAFYSGSDYLRNGASQWIHGWKRKGWTTGSGKPVANRDLWERLDRAMARHKVHWPPVGQEAAAVLDGLERRAKEARKGL